MSVRASYSLNTQRAARGEVSEQAQGHGQVTDGWGGVTCPGIVALLLRGVKTELSSWSSD